MGATQQYREQGNAAFRAGEWRKAIDAYSEAIDLEPTSAILFSNRSAAFLKAGDCANAVRDAQIAIENDPASHKGYGRLAAAYHANKDYDLALEAYKEGLKVSPNQQYLNEGLRACQHAKMSCKGAAAAKAKATRAANKAHAKRKNKVRKATTASAFVEQQRRELKLQQAAIQAQLDLIDELTRMARPEKLELLFTLIDSDGNGTVDAKELAAALRHRNNELSFADSLEKAINMVAVFDQDGDAELDLDEFQAYVKVMLKELQISFDDFAEFLALQIILSDKIDNDDHDISAADVTAEVKAREQLYDLLGDPRLEELFQLFDKDGSNSLTFEEVAFGLYHFTKDMDDSIKTTMEMLLMLDKDNTRMLNFEQFGRLIIAIVSSTGVLFDDLFDDLVWSLMTNQELSDEEKAGLKAGGTIYESAAEMESEINNEIVVAEVAGMGRMNKLFKLWDTDDSGEISFEELAVGFRAFQEATDMAGPSADREAKTLLQFDADGSHELDRSEFSRAMLHFSNSSGLDINELIDFMIVCSVLSPQQANMYQSAFQSSISSRANRI